MCFILTGLIRNLARFILTTLPLTVHPLFSQVLQTDRFEIPLGRSEALFEVAPASEDGLFLYRRAQLNETPLLELIKLDTGFNHQWKGYITLEPKFELAAKHTLGKHLYFLLRHVELARRDMILYIIRQDDGQYEKHVIRNIIPFLPIDFQVTEQAAIIGGYYGNVPVVLHYSFVTQKSRILPGLLNEAGELTQIRTTANGDFSVLISAMTLKGDRTIWIKQYDPDGNLLYHLPVLTDSNKHLLFGRSIFTGNDTQLVAGTYGSRRSEYSKGIFLARIDPSGNQQVKYYSYGDLSNFFKYLKVKREQRIRERIERKKILGKKIRLNYRFIVHEIVPYKDQFVLLGEAFYPKYVTVDPHFSSRFFYTATPRQSIQGGRIFDGFRYTHAVVMGFDEEGRLLWDNSFEINDVKTFTLEQFVKLEMQPDKIALLYLFENQIRSKIIEGDEVLEGKTLEPIRTFSDAETARRERSIGYRSVMDYWYDDFFYACGVQHIASESDERRVFYVNKISYANE